MFAARVNRWNDDFPQQHRKSSVWSIAPDMNSNVKVALGCSFAICDFICIVTRYAKISISREQKANLFAFYRAVVSKT